MNFWFFLYWFEVYSLYSSRTLDKFCEVLFNRVIFQTHRLIFVTLGTRLWWSLELQPCYFSNSPAHLCHFRHQIITKSWTSIGLFLNRTKSFVTNRWFSRVLAHTYRRQWTKFARSLLPTTNMCGRPIRNRTPCEPALRATSRTRMNTRDNCILKSFLCQKYQDRPSSLHIRRCRPKGPEEFSWTKSLHGILYGRL
jgi:hypothetical protein